MRIRSYAVPAAVCAALLAGGIARADDGPHYPGQRPATDARMMVEVALATQYWRARGETACLDGVQVFYARTLRGLDGAAGARGGDCGIWFERDYVNMLRDDNGRAMRREDAATECFTVVHEVGHALGLPHTVGGVMDPYAYKIPRVCRKWARFRYPVRR